MFLQHQVSCHHVCILAQERRFRHCMWGDNNILRNPLLPASNLQKQFRKREYKIWLNSCEELTWKMTNTNWFTSGTLTAVMVIAIADSFGVTFKLHVTHQAFVTTPLSLTTMVGTRILQNGNTPRIPVVAANTRPIHWVPCTRLMIRANSSTRFILAAPIWRL